MNRLTKFILTRNPKLYKLILKVAGRDYKTSETVIYMACVRSGDVVIDAGANQGQYTTIFSHLVGKRGKVHAFEPVPPTFEKLSRNVATYEWFDNVTLNNFAVSDVSGSITLHMPDDDHGQASIMKQTIGSWNDVERITSYDCKSCTLDEYLLNHPGLKPSFIKIDVEGAELLALKGAVETLRKYHPLIHLEICFAWMKNFGYDPIAVISFLQLLGCSEFYFCGENVRLITEPITEMAPESLPVSVNLLCVVPALHAPRLKNIIGA